MTIRQPGRKSIKIWDMPLCVCVCLCGHVSVCVRARSSRISGTFYPMEGSVRDINSGAQSNKVHHVKRKTAAGRSRKWDKERTIKTPEKSPWSFPIDWKAATWLRVEAEFRNSAVWTLCSVAKPHLPSRGSTHSLHQQSYHDVLMRGGMEWSTAPSPFPPPFFVFLFTCLMGTFNGHVDRQQQPKPINRLQCPQKVVLCCFFLWYRKPNVVHCTLVTLLQLGLHIPEAVPWLFPKTPGFVSFPSFCTLKCILNEVQTTNRNSLSHRGLKFAFVKGIFASVSAWLFKLYYLCT